MLTGRPSSIGLLSFIAALSFQSLACSEPAEESSVDSQQINADGLLTLDPNLPFEVTRVHVANGPVLGAHWGKHNGPLATFAAGTDPGEVTRWFAPAGVGSPMMQQPWESFSPEGLPTALFWGSDGFRDLPFGDLALHSYRPTAEPFTGEVFLFARNYESEITRAHVNHYFSGVGITDGTKNRIVYSGRSGFTAETSTTDEPGIWASDVTATSLVPADGSKKLFGWAGTPGPVALDNAGNLFVAARRTDGEHKISIFALTKNQTFATDAVTQATVADADTEGTASLAVASVPASGKGWVFAKGFDSVTAPGKVYARAYTATADQVAAEGDVLAEAIKPADPDTSLSVFGDGSGNLWVALEGSAGSWFVQLSPKQAPSPVTP